MKFALINGEKVVTTKGAKDLCPSCGSELIAKCSELKLKVDHWAHRGNRNCDPWWENESEWHRSWKNNFPKEWQEVVHFHESGEKHIADVKTESGWALEFQHSHLQSEERRARNAFYGKLVWVVDGTRRKTDAPQFEKAIQESSVICEKPLVRRVHFPEECRLLKEWDSGNSLIFFDFQEAQSTRQIMLWFLYPKISNNETYISPFPRKFFIDLHNQSKFDELVHNTIIPNRKTLEKIRQNQISTNVYGRTSRSSGLALYLSNGQRRRRNIRL